MKTALFALACAVGASVVAAEETRESGLRLISTGPSETERSWMTMDQVHELIYSEVGFIDVTDEVNIPSSKLKSTERASSIPTTLSQQSMVNQLTPKVSASNMEATIRHLSTQYTTRYYTNQQSVQAVNWLKGQYESVAKIEGATVELFSHSFLQPSLIARIPGTSHPEEVVVIGGHIDSTSSIGNAPGADDDASGSSAVLEIFRVLNAAGVQFNRTISFEAYAAEEVGLRGSADIARKYAQDGVNVVAMLQLDMIGFKGNNPRIGLITDYTSSELNAFARLMIDDYLEIGYENARCGYGCSDHASFTAQGFPAIFPFELPFGEHNSNIHTPRDTIDKLDMTYAAEFAKLGVAFATELGSL